MAVIQPSLLVDTDRQAETLALGIRAICYELNAPKDEIVVSLLSFFYLRCLPHCVVLLQFLL